MPPTSPNPAATRTSASFTDLLDLASELMGSRVIAANDDFFAEKENLLKASTPIFDADRFTERGKWMDGWETRRRRTPGHDWCIIELGSAGTITGFDIDTSHFDGNQPETASIEGCVARHNASIDELGSDSVTWHELLKSTPLGPSAHHVVASDDPDRRVTHLRFHIHPDGGVARLRAYGTVQPDWHRIVEAGQPVDLASAAYAGTVIACSDMHFSHKDNLILPTEPKNMGSGWETKRRRGPGSDWIIVKLGAPGKIECVKVETTHFKGNYPDSCELEVASLPVNARPNEATSWHSLLRQSKLHPHECHEFSAELNVPDTPVTHVRLTIYPDGGVSRLRVIGYPQLSGTASE